MSYGANIDLLVATLDLKLVQLIRQAILVTDLAGARQAAGHVPDANLQPRRQIHSSDALQPSPKLRPADRFEPRHTIHFDRDCRCLPPLPPPLPQAPDDQKLCQFKIVAPWQVLPWEIPPQPAPKVKIIKIKPDIVIKGSLVDCLM